MVTVRLLEIRHQDDLQREMKLIGSTAPGIKIMAPKGELRVIKVEGLKTPAANILKQEMLARGAEVATARGVIDCQVPVSDAIIMATAAQLSEAFPKLRIQPFGLSKLATQIEELLGSTPARRRQFRCRDRVLEVGERTLVMGVVNVTPDSFSGDGLGANVDAAVERARHMIASGADIVDVGGESTRPGSLPISEEEELERVIPVIERLAGEGAVVSIDTSKPHVAEVALEAGASIVNDITGLGAGKALAEVVAKFAAGLVLMHIKGTPRDMQIKPTYTDLMGEIAGFLRERAALATGAGVDRASIVVDPGIGFGKGFEHNLELLGRLRELRSLGFPLLVGTSRKAFIGRILDLPASDRVEGTAATVALAIANGADMVRVHDVEPMVRVAKVADAIVRR